MIRDPSGVRLLIAAVDRYQNRAWDLNSPPHNVEAILRWQRAWEIPWENTVLHLATRSPLREQLGALGDVLGTAFLERPQRGAVHVRDARRDSIVESIDANVRLDEGSADHLIVFLTGHGFQIQREGEPTTRVYLTEDFTEGVTRHIPVEPLADVLRHTATFRHVSIFFDACAKVPSGANERARLVAGNLNEIRTGALNSRTSVALCCASRPGQFAVEPGVGAPFAASHFVHALLAALEKDALDDAVIDHVADVAVIDLVQLLAEGVVQTVQHLTSDAQTPEVISITAPEERGIVPLVTVDVGMTREQFQRRKRLRDVNRSSLSWLARSLRARVTVVRCRALVDRASQLRTAVATARRGRSSDSGVADALRLAVRDLAADEARVAAWHWELTGDVTGHHTKGSAKLTGAAKLAEADVRGDDPHLLLETVAERFEEGARMLRTAAEASYAKSVWEALSDITRRADGSDPTRVVRLIGEWTALSDGPWMLRTVEAALDHESPPTKSSCDALVRQHLLLEWLRWISRDPATRVAPMDLDALEVLDEIIGAVAEVEEPTWSDLRHRLPGILDELHGAYPALSETLDETIVGLLLGRAG